MKEHFDKILTSHLGKVIWASLACCAIFPDVPPVPLFISSMNLRTYPSNFENFLQGLVHKRYASNDCYSLAQRSLTKLDTMSNLIKEDYLI